MNSVGLPQYVENKASAMRASAAAKPTGEEWRTTIEARCTADDLTGVRKLEIRDFKIVSDSNAGAGGWDLGPTSPEMLCGVLSTCVTHTSLLGASSMGIPLERVAVHVTAFNNDARFFGVETHDPPVPFEITVELTLEAPNAEPGALDRLRAFVDDGCPMLRLVRTPNPLTLTVG